LMANK